MHPTISELIVRQRIAEMHSAAAARRQAREAAASQPEGLPRRDRVELVWPDGVSSVVELPSESAHGAGRGRGLASSKR
jgi:hypothetical protein